MGGSEDLDTYQAFIGFNDEELTSSRILEREILQKQPTPVTMERLLILNTLSDLQLTKESLEDGIRMLSDPRLTISPEVNDKISTRLWVGLRKVILVQKYLHLAAHKSVQLAVKYLRWQAAAEESGSMEDDPLISSRNFVSCLKRLNFVTSPGTEQQFIDLIVPDYEAIVKEIQGETGLKPGRMNGCTFCAKHSSIVTRKGQRSSSVEEDRDLEVFLDVKSEEAGDAIDHHHFMKSESETLSSTLFNNNKSLLQGEMSSSYAGDTNEESFIDIKLKEIMEVDMIETSSHLEDMAEEETPSSHDTEFKFMKQEDETTEEDVLAADTCEDKPHRCLICGKSYRSNSKLQDHLNAHTGTKPHQCEVCNKGFSSKDSLRQHQKIHSFDKLSCEFCFRGFNTKSALNRHKRTAHAGQKLTAASRELMLSADDMTEAVDELSGDKNQLGKCSVCHKLFDSLAELNDHARIDHDGLDTFDLEEDDGLHLDKEDSAKDRVNSRSLGKSLKCRICTKTFGSKDALRLHQKIHSEDKFKCDHCVKVFKTRTHLYKHRQKEHSGMPDASLESNNGEDRDVGTTFECDICNAEFDNITDCRDHQAKEHNLKQDGESYTNMEDDNSNSSDLASPRLGKTGSGPQPKKKAAALSLKCEYCGKSFRSRSRLQDHVNTHTGEKRHKCDICQKSFNSRDRLRLHKDVHSTRDFPCDLCSRTYKTRDSLQSHKSMTHRKIQNVVDPVSKRVTGTEAGPRRRAPTAAEEDGSTDVHAGLHIESDIDSDDLESDDDGEDGDGLRPSAVLSNDQGNLEAVEANFESIVQENDGKIRFKCLECGKLVVNRRRMVDHINIHTGETPHKCDACPKSFTSRLRLSYHADIHTARTFPCGVCDKMLNTRICVMRHKKAFHSGGGFDAGRDVVAAANGAAEEEDNNEDPSVNFTELPSHEYSCNFCSKVLRCRTKMKYHVNVHTGRKPFQCDVCAAAYHSTDLLRVHKESRHPGKFPCRWCEYVAPVKAGLTHHITTAHSHVIQQYDAANGGGGGEEKACRKQNQREMCPFCGTFVPRRYLRYHIYRHTGEKPYKCKLCPKSFASPINLSVHSDVHVERTFLCPLCGKLFNTRATLRVHKRKIHHYRTRLKDEEAKEEKDLSAS